MVSRLEDRRRYSGPQQQGGGTQCIRQGMAAASTCGTAHGLVSVVSMFGNLPLTNNVTCASIAAGLFQKHTMRMPAYARRGIRQKKLPPPSAAPTHAKHVRNMPAIHMHTHAHPFRTAQGKPHRSPPRVFDWRQATKLWLSSRQAARHSLQWSAHAGGVYALAVVGSGVRPSSLNCFM